MDVIKKFEPLFGEWYAESLIGVGSFGRVYKIYREELGQRMYSALKYISIPQDEAETEALYGENMSEQDVSTYYNQIAQQLREEISLMNELKGNTNIVSYEDSRILPKPGGMGYDIFIRMELLEPLRSYARRREMDESEVAKLGSDICNALALCADSGIIHRDIKPDNIFVNRKGSYKLGDFGIARRLEKTSTFMSKKGTYNYMAPEVYKGEKYGASCDIYSLGMVMYSFLNNGRLPFLPPAPQPITPNDRERALTRRMNGEAIPAPCGASGELADIVLKACAYEPKGRFGSPEEMRAALNAVCKTEANSGKKARASAPEKDEGTAGSAAGVAAGIAAVGFGSSGSMDKTTAADFAKPAKNTGTAVSPRDELGTDKTTAAYAVQEKKPKKAEQKPKNSASPAADKGSGELLSAHGAAAQPGGAGKASAAKEVNEAKPADRSAKGGGNNGNTKKKIGLIAGIAAALAVVLGILAIAGVFGKRGAEDGREAMSDATQQATEAAAADGESTPEATARETENAAENTPAVTATAQATAHEIAFVTDVGQLMDRSFNQGTWEGCEQYAKDNGKTVKYYQPANGENATDADRFEAMKAAVEGGAKIVVCAGFMQATALTQAAVTYPEVNFVFIDGWPLTDGYDGPVLKNVAGIAYKEEQAGFFAGYAVVMEGYTKLGFCGGGGGSNPACCRYGFGFVQGAAAAAEAKNVDIEINYSWEYGAAFSASPELQAMAAGWYENGTEIIFACGGSMFASVAAAASANDAKVVGVDVDQSSESTTVVTSAMKGLSASVVWAIGKYYDGNWSEIGGQAVRLGVNDNAVALPTETWSLQNWTVEDYNALFEAVKNGTVVVSPDYPEDMSTYKSVHVHVIVVVCD